MSNEAINTAEPVFNRDDKDFLVKLALPVSIAAVGGAIVGVEINNQIQGDKKTADDALLNKIDTLQHDKTSLQDYKDTVSNNQKVLSQYGLNLGESQVQASQAIAMVDSRIDRLEARRPGYSEDLQISLPIGVAALGIIGVGIWRVRKIIKNSQMVQPHTLEAE